MSRRTKIQELLVVDHGIIESDAKWSAIPTVDSGSPYEKIPPLTLTPTHSQGSLLDTQPSIDHGMDASDASQLSTLGNGGTETERSLPLTRCSWLVPTPCFLVRLLFCPH